MVEKITEVKPIIGDGTQDNPYQIGSDTDIIHRIAQNSWQSILDGNNRIYFKGYFTKFEIMHSHPNEKGLPVFSAISTENLIDEEIILASRVTSIFTFEAMKQQMEEILRK